MTRRGRRRSRAPQLISFLALLFPLSLAPFPVWALESGDKAPFFSVPQLVGSGRVTLEGYRGKVVFLDFWASRCPPCLTDVASSARFAGAGV
jgi:thiol-disulfide isomerase/thioredoxin